MPTFHPVSAAFLSQCAAVTASVTGDGSVLWYTTRLWPRVDESGSWAFGTASGVTMSAAVLDELQAATGANADGTYTIASGTRALYLTSAGACEPSGPPPPAP